MHVVEPDPDGRSRIHPESREEWREWLAAHHDTEDGVWVVRWRQAAGRSGLTYDELVREALCFGWIDGTAGTLDAFRTLQYCSPRKRGSGWARTNKVRIAELEAEGAMTAAGAAVIAAAQADGSWTLLDDVEALVVPDDLREALAAREGATEHWESFPPSAKKLMLSQLVLAKRPATRAARVVRIADAASKGERGYP